MGTLRWIGKTQQVHVLRLNYTSGEPGQLVRWVQKWDAEILARDIPQEKALETKRQELLAAYRAAGASDEHPEVAFLLRVDSHKQVRPLGTWQLVSNMFDIPSLGSYRSRGIYVYDLSSIEIVESRTVTA